MPMSPLGFWAPSLVQHFVQLLWKDKVRNWQARCRECKFDSDLCLTYNWLILRQSGEKYHIGTLWLLNPYCQYWPQPLAVWNYPQACISILKLKTKNVGVLPLSTPMQAPSYCLATFSLSFQFKVCFKDSVCSGCMCIGLYTRETEWTGQPLIW